MDRFNEFYERELLWSVCGMSVWSGLLSQVNWDGLKCFHNFSLNIHLWFEANKTDDETTTTRKNKTHTHTICQPKMITNSNNSNNDSRKKCQTKNEIKKPTKIPERSAHQDKIDTQFYKGENQMNTEKKMSNTTNMKNKKQHLNSLQRNVFYLLSNCMSS